MNGDDPLDVEEVFLSVCPSFRALRDEMRREWREGEPSLFNVFSELGHHLAQRIEEGEMEEAKSTFRVAEEILTSGSEVAVHATTLGLLTSLQRSLKQGGMNPDALGEHFGPRTKAWWDDLDKNWEGRLDW